MLKQENVDDANKALKENKLMLVRLKVCPGTRSFMGRETLAVVFVCLMHSLAGLGGNGHSVPFTVWPLCMDG